MNNKQIENFQNDLRKTRDILKHEGELRKIFGSRYKGIRDNLEVIIEDIQLITNSENPKSGEKERRRIKKTVDLFFNVALSQHMPPIFKDLSNYYLRIVYNWNEMIESNPDISSKIKKVIEITKDRISINTSVHLLRSSTDNISSLLSQEPDSFELSRSYLKNLNKATQEKIDKE